LVGLFGTVYSILKALISAGLDQPSFDKMAGPVGEALIMTAIGLAVAVPALIGYNILQRRNNAIKDSLHDFAGDLEANLIGGLRPDFGRGVRALVTRK
jgi:biopolymer transport protein ExbB